MRKILSIILLLPIFGFTQNLAIGDTYQSGIVFWLDGNGGGLIAAPSDQSTETTWGCTASDISETDGTAIGTGNQNTIDIEAGCLTTGTAADICANLTLGGFSDWFLPSKDELNQMYLNIGQASILSNIGNFDNAVYWSSSEYNLYFAWCQSFLSGTPQHINKVVMTYNVRAIRAFSVISGCTDSLASNYDPLATIDDGSCICTKSLTQELIGFVPNPVSSLWNWSYDTLTLTNTSNCDVRVRPQFDISHNISDIDTNDFDITYWNPFGFWTPIAYTINLNGHAVGYWGIGGDTTGQVLSQGTIQQVIIRVRFKPGANYGDYCAVWNTKEVDNIGSSLQMLTTGSSTCLSFTNLNCTNFSVLNSYSSNITCLNSNDGSAGILSIQNGSGSYLYNWNNGDTANIITDLVSGEYYCIITDENWPQCSDSIGFTISEPPLLDNGIIINNSTCFGSNDSYIEINPTEDGIPLTNFEVFLNSSINLGQSDSIALSNGIHHIQVQNTINTCFSVIDTFEITAPPPLTSSYTQTNNLCFGDTSGSAIVTFLGGTTGAVQGDTNYILGWAGTPLPVYLPYPQNVFNTTLLPSPYNEIPTGIYPYTVIDMNGCIIYDTITITQPDSLTLSISADTICCLLGSFGTANAIVNGGIAPYSYYWNDALQQASSFATGLDSGTYYCTVTDENGCSVIDSIEVYKNAPISTSISLLSTLCFGDSNGCINTNTTGGDGNYTYIWSNGDTTANICNLSAGNYTCLITDGCGCTEFITATILQPNPISINIDSLDNISVYSGNDGSIFISTIGGSNSFNYVWTSNNGFLSNNEDNVNLIAGVYYLSITDANSCHYIDTIELIQPSSLSLNLSYATNPSCFDSCNGSINISANGGDSTYNYTWVGPNSFSSNNEDLISLCAGTYIIILDDGITILTDTFNIIEPQEITSVLSVDSIICHNGFAQVQINVWGGTQPLLYSWSNGDNNYITTLNSGIHSINVSDQNGCSINQIFSLSNPDSIISTNTTTNIDCYGENNATISVNIISGGTGPYNFSINNGITYQNSNSFNNLYTGNYIILISDSNGCLDSTYANVIGPDELNNTVLSTNASCYDTCNGSISNVTFGGTPPYSYLCNNLQSNQNITDLCAGFYNITITDSNNCLSINSVIVNEPNPLLVNVWHDGIGLTATSTFESYQWFDDSNNPITGANDTSYTPNSSGMYYVQVSDTNGCYYNSYRINYTTTNIYEHNVNLIIYPNPTRGLVKIEGIRPSSNINIIDYLGNQLLKVENNNIALGTLDIDLSTFAKGIYFIQVKENYQIINHKIVLQ